MNDEVVAIEAVEWRQPAPGGGSQAQIFRLTDGRFALVKFPENPQGQLVLANEFLCCQIAEHLELAVNRAVHVRIDERLLVSPRQTNPAFSAGVSCGMIYLEGAEGGQIADILANCSNHAELHHIVVFEQLVNRQDARLLLMYVPEGEKTKKFAACDYGYALGGIGNANWSAATLGTVAPPVLPPNDPFTGNAYPDGAALAGFIDKLRSLSSEQLRTISMRLHPPRWGLTVDDVQALVIFLEDRAQSLVKQFDQRYQPPQLEIFDGHN